MYDIQFIFEFENKFKYQKNIVVLRTKLKEFGKYGVRSYQAWKEDNRSRNINKIPFL